MGRWVCGYTRALPGIASDESFRLVKKMQDVTNEVIDKLSAVADARKTEINNS